MEMKLVDYQKFAQNIAVETPDGTTLTYSELKSRVDELAQRLNPGHLLVVLAENSVDSLIAYLAAFEAECTVLLLNKDIKEAALKRIIDDFLPEYMWLPIVQMSRGTIAENAISVRYSNLNYTLLRIGQHYNDLPLDLRLLLSTSGSTGAPKLVRLSEHNIISNATSIADYLHINSDERPITSLPMYYSFGLSVINSHLMSGARLLLTDYSYVQREFWNFATDSQATSFAGVPYTYEILKKLKFWKRQLPSLRTLTQAGGKLSNELVEEFTQQAINHGKDFVVMYGQTEATARMSYMPAEQRLQKIGSIGIPIPGGRFEIENEDGRQLGDDETGELIYYGSNVSLGYAERRSDLLRSDENNGRLATGDMARRDSDGFYYIVGRKKRFLKMFGNRISLDHVEQLLHDKYDAEFVCTGIDNHLKCYTTASDINLADLKFYIADVISLHHSAVETQYISTIPRSETGKVLYHNL